MAEDSESLNGTHGGGMEADRREGQSLAVALVGRADTEEMPVSRDEWKQVMLRMEKLEHGMDAVLQASKLNSERRPPCPAHVTASAVPPVEQKKVVRKTWDEKPRWLEEATGGDGGQGCGWKYYDKYEMKGFKERAVSFMCNTLRTDDLREVEFNRHLWWTLHKVKEGFVLFDKETQRKMREEFAVYAKEWREEVQEVAQETPEDSDAVREVKMYWRKFLSLKYALRVVMAKKEYRVKRKWDWSKAEAFLRKWDRGLSEKVPSPKSKWYRYSKRMWEMFGQKGWHGNASGSPEERLHFLKGDPCALVGRGEREDTDDDEEEQWVSDAMFDKELNQLLAGREVGSEVRFACGSEK